MTLWDAGHFYQSAEVGRCLLKPHEDAATLLELPNESFDDVAIAVGVLVEFDQTRVTVLVNLGRNE